MTLEEARKVATICEEADGSCSVCVRELGEKLAEAFPQFMWRCEKVGTYCEIVVEPIEGDQ